MSPPSRRSGPFARAVRSRLDYLESAGLLHDRNEPERVAVLSGIRPVASARRPTAVMG